MAYEREAQTDLAELQRLAAGRVETDPPSGYERDAQSDVMELGRLARDLSETNPAAGGYERVGQTDIAVLRRKLIGGAVVVPPATGYSLAGPSSGNVGVASTNFTVALTPLGGTVVGTVTITPSDGGGGGTFTPSTVGLTTVAPSATFTYTPASAGAKTISCTNSGGLTNPGNLTYTSTILPVFLLDNLTSYWKLDEATGAGNRVDSQGTNHLVVSFGNISGVAAKIGNGVYQNGSGGAPYLSCASNSTLQVTSDFTFSMWVRVDDPATNLVYLSKNNPAFSAVDYVFSNHPTVGLSFGNANVGSPSGAFSVYHVVGWWDSSDSKFHLRVNDATTYTASSTTTLVQGTDPFAVLSASYGNVNWNGWIDEIGYWKRKLTPGEITALYNGGAGLPFSSFTGTHLADGDPVFSWQDSSGNGNSATQTGGARPTFKTNIVNGKPVVRFTSAGLSGLNLTTPLSVTPWAVFAVMKTATAASIIHSVASGPSPGMLGTLINSDTKVYCGDKVGLIFSTTSPTTAFHVITTGMSGVGTGVIYSDGVSLGLSTVAAATAGNFDVIGWRNSPIYSDGDIAEIIVYTVSMPGTDRQNIEKYLGDKYGITVAAGSAVQPNTVAGLIAWWKADSLL